MRVDRREFLWFGSTGLIALTTTKLARAELPALLQRETFSRAPAKAVFARAFNLWMDDAVRHEQQWSHETDDVALFRKQLHLGIKPAHGAGAAGHLLRYLKLGESPSIAPAETQEGVRVMAPAEALLGRAFNLWMYDTARHPDRFSHEADDVASFRKQAALGIEPRYGMRAAGNLLHFLEQAQVAA